VPVFAVIGLGYGLARTPLFSGAGIKGLSNFVFFVSVPALLFRTLAKSEAHAAADFALIQSYFLVVILLFGLTMLIGRVVFRLDLQDQGLMAMGATFSNTVMLGIPLVYAAFGEAGLLLMMLIVSFHSAILIPLTTTVVELGRGAGGHPLKVLGSTMLALLQNPIIVSIAAGLLWSEAGLPIPTLVDRMLAILAAASLPATLFVLGATLTTFEMRGDAVQGGVLVALKMVVHPVLAWLVGTYVFALEHLPLAVAVMVAALPTGINVFILAERYGRYVRRTATAVLVSTALALLSQSALVALFADPK
jgi:predicted permease